MAVMQGALVLCVWCYSVIARGHTFMASGRCREARVVAVVGCRRVDLPLAGPS